MNRLKLKISKPTVIVGLDFGTTFSGFAYALASKPEECLLFYEWPGLSAAGASNYCKTQTSLLYSNEAGERSSAEFSAGSYVLQGWGHDAQVQHAAGNSRKTRVSTDGGGLAHFITRFKLHLAGSEKTSAADLPEGLTPRRTISDYLRKLSELIIIVLREDLGNHIIMENVQWCLTVPTIWDEKAKQEMKTCAEIAGLVQGQHCKNSTASPHPAIIVLEPEAASFYCQRISDFPFEEGDKFLVVDAGGGTVDLALHEKAGPPWSKKVKEVAPSSGGLCGGTYVDEGFFKFLALTIRCFKNFAEEHPQSVLKLQSSWEPIKCNFDGNMQSDYELELPAKLARAWEGDDASKSDDLNAVPSYDSITFTLEVMLTIFDPVVDQILQLIDQTFIPDLKAMMIVGGFSASPYLKNRIKAAFSQRVAPGTIIFPKNPGSAICCGAVAFGVGGSDLLMSRISKKTYGIETTWHFREGDPKHLRFFMNDGTARCRNVFTIFTRKGDDVSVDCCVSHKFCPLYDDMTETQIRVFSTSDTDPHYVTDPGTCKEGEFTVHHPSTDELGTRPEIKVSMYFGRTTIEVQASGKNFGSGKHFAMPMPVFFEKSFERFKP